MSAPKIGAVEFFDALHPGATWKPWRAFVCAVYGHPLDAEELEIFRACTGLETPRPGGYPEACCIVGVQSGKSSVIAAMGVHAALTAERGTHALMMAQDHRSAMRALLAYARAPFETLAPFKREVLRDTADTLTLRNGVSLSAYPCKPSAARGIRACIVALDELAFFTATDGRPTDTEMLRVARGRVANTGGKVLILSSPYGQTGALYDLHRKHHGTDSAVLVWQASAPVMNPTLSADYLDRMEEDDPEAYKSEVLGEFRAGLAAFLDPDALDAVINTGVRERPRAESIRYSAHFDASGGRHDAAALAIAHRSGEAAVLDLVRRWPAPHNPGSVIAEAAAVLRTYGITNVQIDRFAGEFPAEHFRTLGIKATVNPKSTSDTYLELLPAVNTGAVLLLDEPTLLRELRGLERRPGGQGRDRVDHRRGAHDDLAAAAAGALVSLSKRPKLTKLVLGRDRNDPRTGEPSLRRQRLDRLKWAAGIAAAHDRASSRVDAGPAIPDRLATYPTNSGPAPTDRSNPYGLSGPASRGPATLRNTKGE